MKLLAIEREIPGVKETNYQPFLKSEALRVWELYKSGVIREIYFTDEQFAIIILECTSLEEAEKHLDTLPLVQENLITFDIVPLMPYSGFERLFHN
jgi:hypothetical protein